MSACSYQRIGKAKIELTHRNSVSRNNSKSKERIEIKTPPKFRTLQSEVSANIVSRYTTLEKKQNTTNSKLRSSTETSAKKKHKHLSIDTDIINQEH